MRLSFHGAARSVTGSRQCLKCRATDYCWIAASFKDAERKPIGRTGSRLRPESRIEAVLSHAHIDHSGALPVLPKHGFQGMST